jgi:nucleotide-binding universal stress UspA family protein
MRNLLVATDFTEVGNNTVNYVLEAAKDINANVVVYHFFKLSGHSANAMISTKEMDRMLAQKKLGFENYVSKLSIIHNIKITAVFKHVDFFDELQQTIDDVQPMLLAFGMPAKSLEQEIFGSITKMALRRTDFPVLAIPPGYIYKKVKHVVYACDMRKGVHAIILQKIKRYAMVFNASVEILHVGSSVNELVARNAVAAALDGIHFYYKDIEAASVMQGILDEVDATNADVVIMTPHKYGFWSSMLHRSKTLGILSKSKVPILSIGY